VEQCDIYLWIRGSWQGACCTQTLIERLRRAKGAIGSLRLAPLSFGSTLDVGRKREAEYLSAKTRVERGRQGSCCCQEFNCC
jgi:hypothetical protein